MIGSIVHLKTIIRKIIYKLKWSYGFPIDIYTTTVGVYNTQTGKKTVTSSKIRIRRAIVFPGLQHRNFFFSISQIQANSKFITGGDIQVGDRQFIIDGRDLPRGFVMNLDNYIIWDHIRYDFIKIMALEANTGWFIDARAIENAKPYEIHDETLKDKLVIQSEVTNES